MGWWNMPGGAGVMGDDPADQMTAALLRLGEDGGQPTTVQVLAAVAAALRDAPDELMDPARPFAAIVYKMNDGSQVRSDTVGPPRAPDVPVLRDGFVSAGLTWRQSFGRKPTLDELLYAVTFVFCYKPQRYCSDGADWNIRSLAAT